MITIAPPNHRIDRSDPDWVYDVDWVSVVEQALEGCKEDVELLYQAFFQRVACEAIKNLGVDGQQVEWWAREAFGKLLGYKAGPNDTIERCTPALEPWLQSAKAGEAKKIAESLMGWIAAVAVNHAIDQMRVMVGMTSREKEVISEWIRRAEEDLNTDIYRKLKEQERQAWLRKLYEELEQEMGSGDLRSALIWREQVRGMMNSKKIKSAHIQERLREEGYDLAESTIKKERHKNLQRARDFLSKRIGKNE